MRVHSWTRAGLIGVVVALASVVGATGASADDFSVGGAFNDPNDLLLIEFSHASGPFTAFTAQWNGGVPSGSAPPAATPSLDGFDAILELFTGGLPGATLSALDDDGGNGFSATVDITTFTGGRRDSLLDLASLAAGTYTLGLSNFANASATTPSGYSNTGQDGSSGDRGFTGADFRVHLLGVNAVLSAGLASQRPVSVSGPFEPPPS